MYNTQMNNLWKKQANNRQPSDNYRQKDGSGSDCRKAENETRFARQDTRNAARNR